MPWSDEYSSNVSMANVNISIGDKFCARTPREDQIKTGQWNTVFCETDDIEGEYIKLYRDYQ